MQILLRGFLVIYQSFGSWHCNCIFTGMHSLKGSAMATFISAEMASQQRLQRVEPQRDDSPPAKRMHAVWRAVWWLLFVNVLLFWGLTGIIALV